ncbi:GAF domain-containing SpoIIE family protein phosphatase [Streptomyces sp. NPDC005283]|uniref:PP2C family protein-serine/threonine phosphatase n=1 Tax=Streptomyces sp. NPDC005283 TaxID=3156871 RepID=UPI003455DCCF
MSADSLGESPGPSSGASPGASSEAADSVGLAVLDTHARYLFADRGYCRIAGEVYDGLVGSPVSPRVRPRAGSELLLAGVLADGNPRTHVTDATRCTWQRLTIDKDVVALMGIIVETTPARAAARESAPYSVSVAESSDRIGTTLDEDTTCRELVSFLSPGLADAAEVDLLLTSPPTFSPAGGDLRAIPLPGVYRAAVAGHADLLPQRPADPLGAAVRSMHGSRPVLDDRVLAVPLLAHGHVLGAVLAARTHGRFDRDDVLIVRSAVLRAATAIEHSRLYGQAQRTAVQLQQALLTEPGRPHPNLQLATRYLPSGSGTIVGGDWFETVRLHFGRTLLVMGDVMGHGVEAAVDMNSYRSTLRDVASADLPPDRVLRQLDVIISESTRRPATCLLVRVDPVRGTGAFSSAGHLPPAVFGGDGGADLVRVPVGPPLGTGLGGYEIATRELHPGDTLLLFTDGLVERRGEDIDSSLARLARVQAAPGITVDGLLDEVLGQLDAAHADDDVALMAARIRRRPASDHH